MFAAIVVPDFRLQAVLRHAPELCSKAVALISEQQPHACILQCTPEAHAAGVVIGMTTSQARARCDTLIVRERSPAAERPARAAMLDCAYAFSPFHEDTAEGVCTLEWKDARLPEAGKIAQAMIAQLASLHLLARVGFAPNAGLALLAAQSAKTWTCIQDARELADLSVESLAPSERTLELLRRWGIRTVGAFTALQREHLVERLGAEAATLYDRATGQATWPLRCVLPAETYEEAVEFEQEIEMLEPLLFMLRRFLEQIARRLETTYLVAAEVTLRIGFTTGEDHVRTFKVPAPTADVEVLFRMLHTHLEKLAAEHPIVSLHLVAIPSRPARQQFELFAPALRDPNQFYETLARLIALVGNDRVGMPVCEPTHRPDAFRMAAVHFGTEKELTDDPACEMSLTLRRFRPPLGASVQFQGRPCSLVSAPVRGQVRTAEGPYHASGDWWDAMSWDRAEWDVQIADGTLCRIYCEGETWFLEGIYD